MFEGSEQLTNYTCQTCGSVFCAKCKVAWHHDQTCEAYQEKLKKEQEEKEAEEKERKEKLAQEESKNLELAQQLVKKKKGKACPKCGEYVFKAWGCHHMKCGYFCCGHEFCYICFRDWKVGKCPENLEHLAMDDDELAEQENDA